MQRNNCKIALITGASVGIGTAVAKHLCQLDYQVVITARRSNLLRLVCEECNLLRKNSCTYFICDLSCASNISRLLGFIKETYGRIDLIVNNACWRGRSGHCINSQSAIEDLPKVIKTNLTVPLLLVNEAVRCFKPSNLVVINISSSASKVVVPLHCYSISKSCISELTRQLAKTSHETGIVAITISPGVVVTEDRPDHINYSNYTLSGRVGSTGDIAKFVTNVLNNPNIFNGKELFVDGGQTSKQMSPYISKINDIHNS